MVCLANFEHLNFFKSSRKEVDVATTVSPAQALFYVAFSVFKATRAKGKILEFTKVLLKKVYFEIGLAIVVLKEASFETGVDADNICKW